MKIFVTGVTGYIGSAVSQTLARAGHRVYGLVRSKQKAKAVAAEEIEPVFGSMEDVNSFRDAARSCHVLVHCAVEYSPNMMELDRKAAEGLIACSREAGAPRLFLYTSGVWVYGDTGDTMVDETTPLNPPELATGRVQIEKIVLAANRDQVRTIILRPGCVYGGHGSLTATWFESAVKEGAARIVGDGGFRWAMVHLQDLANLYLRAAESPWSHEIFNATDRSRSTIYECARAASLMAGAGGKVNMVPVDDAAKALGAVANCLALNQHVDSSKAVRLLGWQPRHGGFVDGVAQYFLSWKAAAGMI